MPYYDYKCVKCQEIFEIKRGMEDLTVPNCPKCKAPAIRVFNLFRTGAGSNTIANSSKSSCSSCSSGVCSSCGSN